MQAVQDRRPGRLVGGGTVSVLLALSFLVYCSQAARAQQAAVPQAQASSLLPAGPQAQLPTASAARAHLVESYGHLPLSFEANRGQAPAPVQFLARGAGYTLFLAKDGATVVLRDSQAGANGGERTAKAGAVTGDSVLAMRLAGANSSAAVAGIERLPGDANYFIGNDPRAWRTHVPTYGKVSYHSVYPGVDLVYYGHSGQLEYDFVVAPGADPSTIALDVAAGAARPAAGSPQPASLRIVNGDLLVKTSGGEVRFRKPVVYQAGLNGERQYVEAGYTIGKARPRARNQDSTVGFKVGAYNPRRELVIDPTLDYSTYLGGTGTDSALGIAVDTSGDVYVTGQASSTNFPVKDPYQATNGGGTTDAFVTKISPDGLSIAYSTYLGGSGNDVGAGIAIDATGDAYVTGNTNSTNFPVCGGPGCTTGAKQPLIGGLIDAFVTELNADGSSLNYSTYLGGTQDDFGTAIAVDGAGEAYVAGETSSNNFVATKNGYQTVNSGGGDAFFEELDAEGTPPALYASFLGGAGSDVAEGIALEGGCETQCVTFITGQTTSLNFPVSATAYQKTSGGETDAFVTEINPADSGAASLVYSTYFGGTGNDIAYGIAVDPTGEAYFAGSTTSSSKFPVTSGAFGPALKGTEDAFVAKLDAGGSTLAYSTYLGGTGVDSAAAIAIDSSGDAFVTGNTQSTDFPTVQPTQAVCATTSGALCDDAFVASLGPDGAFLNYSTYLGGGLHDAGTAVAVDASDNLYVAGATLSTDFPTTAGVFQPACAVSSTGACGNAFILEVGPAAPPVQLTPQVIPFGAEPLGVPSKSQIITVLNNSGSTVTFTSITASGNFAVDATGTSCFTSTPLSFGASCAIAVTFSPTVSGDVKGTLTLKDNATGSPQIADLSGTGVTSVVAVTPATLTFGNQFVGTTSAPQTATLVNSGATTLTITSVSVTAGSGFAQTNTCGTSVAAGASCTISVSFTPTASGTASGTLSVTDSAAGSPQTVSLTGTGVSPTASLSATTVNFGSVPVGTTASTPQKIVLTNTGNETLSITSISVGGAQSSDFTLSPSNPCGSSVAQGSSCTITINFKPASSSPAARSATLTFNDNAPNSPQVVALTGSASDFSLAVAPTGQTVNPGATTTYTLTLTPLGGFSGSVGLTCAGQPINTSCTLSLSSANLSGSSPVNVTATVVTSAPTAAPPGGRRLPPANRLFRLAWPVWLLLGSILALLRFTRPQARRAWMVIATTLVLVTLWMGCGNSLTAPPTVAAGTPAGTYTLTLTGTSGGLGHSATATLTVN